MPVIDEKENPIDNFEPVGPNVYSYPPKNIVQALEFIRFRLGGDMTENYDTVAESIYGITETLAGPEIENIDRPNNILSALNNLIPFCEPPGPSGPSVLPSTIKASLTIINNTSTALKIYAPFDRGQIQIPAGKGYLVGYEYSWKTTVLKNQTRNIGIFLPSEFVSPKSVRYTSVQIGDEPISNYEYSIEGSYFEQDDGVRIANVFWITGNATITVNETPTGK